MGESGGEADRVRRAGGSTEVAARGARGGPGTASKAQATTVGGIIVIFILFFFFRLQHRRLSSQWVHHPLPCYPKFPAMASAGALRAGVPAVVYCGRGGGRRAADSVWSLGSPDRIRAVCFATEMKDICGYGLP